MSNIDINKNMARIVYPNITFIKKTELGYVKPDNIDEPYRVVNYVTGEEIYSIEAASVRQSKSLLLFRPFLLSVDTAFKRNHSTVIDCKTQMKLEIPGYVDMISADNYWVIFNSKDSYIIRDGEVLRQYQTKNVVRLRNPKYPIGLIGIDNKVVVLDQKCNALDPLDVVLQHTEYKHLYMESDEDLISSIRYVGLDSDDVIWKLDQFGLPSGKYFNKLYGIDFKTYMDKVFSSFKVVDLSGKAQ